MKAAVSVAAAADYRPATVEKALDRLLGPLGGMAAFVRPGQTVLIKPNLLAGRPPEQAVTTHPELVRAVIRQVQAAGGHPRVGDSPGIGSPRQVAERSGVLGVIEETGADFASFSESVRVRAGGTFHELEVARDLLEADVILNLPKLKTHQMMGLTCAVKNLFGAVVGMRKPRLHLQAGTDKSFFALMLLELTERLRPALTIVDAITAMEGNGPGSGDPIHLGALLAGPEPLAVDAVAIDLLGLAPASVWTQKVALETGRPFARREEIELHGDSLEALRPAAFRPARATDVSFGLPAILKGPLKRSLSALPTVAADKCALCGLCLEHCPPKAMAIRGERLVIDPKACIGCFCCQELCPRGAITARQGLLLRLSRLFSRA